MRKLPIYLVLFFLLFSYSFILAVPMAKADCNCICADGAFIQVATKPQCTPTACQGHGGVTNPVVCQDIPTASTPGTATDQPATGSSNGQVVLTDPLNLPAGDPSAFWGRLIGALLAFVGVGALVTFVYAGFMFLTSSGNPEQVKKAKDTMLYAVIGVAVSMGAYVILSYIFDILQGSVGQG